jgi:acylphosphatase
MKASIIVQGLVQGVGYRFFTVDMARKYKIKGYARNLPDGNVEVIAEGNQGMLNDFVKQLKIGPHSSKVTAIDVKWSEQEYGYTDFNIRY